MIAAIIAAEETTGWPDAFMAVGIVAVFCLFIVLLVRSM